MFPLRPQDWSLGQRCEGRNMETAEKGKVLPGLVSCWSLALMPEPVPGSNDDSGRLWAQVELSQRRPLLRDACLSALSLAASSAANGLNWPPSHPFHTLKWSAESSESPSWNLLQDDLTLIYKNESGRFPSLWKSVWVNSIWLISRAFGFSNVLQRAQQIGLWFEFPLLL